MANTTSTTKTNKIVAKEKVQASASILTAKELAAVKKFREGFPPSIIIGIPVPEFWKNRRLTAAQEKQFKALNADIKKAAKALSASLLKVEKLAAKKFEAK
ncbi:MAG: hypothetical protein II565_02160 [Fibrobacter sp.]|nr:hypothetical protein [Fibrobacter sp.]